MIKLNGEVELADYVIRKMTLTKVSFILVCKLAGNDDALIICQYIFTCSVYAFYCTVLYSAALHSAVSLYSVRFWPGLSCPVLSCPVPFRSVLFVIFLVELRFIGVELG